MPAEKSEQGNHIMRNKLQKIMIIKLQYVKRVDRVRHRNGKVRNQTVSWVRHRRWEAAAITLVGNKKPGKKCQQ